MAEQSVDGAATEESLAKKMKAIEPEEASKVADSVHDTALRLSSFQMTRILNVNSMRKQLMVEGTFKGQESPAIVIMEKKVFPEDDIFLKRGFFNEGTIIRKVYSNDVYGNYECFPTREHNGLNVTIIHPASQKHLDKFSRKELYLVNETYEIYESVTLPYLESNSFSLQWVDNILSHKAEYDKIIYEDKDKEKGFIMLPDLKWDGTLASLDILVLAKKRIKSLRELNDSHLPLLRNIRDTGTDVIKKKYNLSSSQLRIYLHYQPSYYHLHVHFSYLMHEVPGIHCEKAHLISTVINNIEIVPDYYQKAVLSFVVKENDPLCKKYQESGVLTVIDSQTEI
ncbi:PREDICTED: m7GpppX diphosphatase [Ceratosolen solmsi marchali]|uniref:m7GpppX diphosphatase n=1 Tax=Ceratosolen solmsi marchali TaxID=326594 RepID=A0AAJ7DY10_9HYME|nr:PREDICTED: m7GpppX diphosphatase [Ceratosolen solmsi marchali]